MTLPVDLYPWFALISSAAITILFVRHLMLALRWYGHAPQRAGPSLLLALVLVICGLGLIISSLGTFVEEQPHTLPSIGLSIVRGALLLAAIVVTMGARQGPRQ